VFGTAKSLPDVTFIDDITSSTALTRAAVSRMLAAAPHHVIANHHSILLDEGKQLTDQSSGSGENIAVHSSAPIAL